MRWFTPDAGEVSAGEAPPSPASPSDVGYMLQKDLLLPWRSALANAMLGLEIPP